MNDKIRVCICDGHLAVRSGLRALLASDDGIEVVADTPEPGSFIEMCDSTRPDVLLLDLGSSGGNGLDHVPALIECCPDLAVVIVTGSNRAHYIDEAIKVGVKGYLTHVSLRESGLVEAVRSVHAGRLYLDPVASAAFIESRRSGVDARLSSLTAREREVLRLLGEGLSNKEISEGLSISQKTVRNHLSNAYMKLGIESRLQAGILARELSI